MCLIFYPSFVFWFCFQHFTLLLIGCALYPVVGAVYLIYHLIFKKSIVWSDFNLQNDGGELLQAGLGLFLLQVG